jgi:hypothetical protein
MVIVPASRVNMKSNEYFYRTNLVVKVLKKQNLHQKITKNGISIGIAALNRMIAANLVRSKPDRGRNFFISTTNRNGENTS